MKRRERMWTHVTALPTPLTAEGRAHQVAIEGLQRGDGTWAGRIVFTDGARVRRTGQETSQPNREALEYWASGLEKVYLEGAYQRSQ